MLSPQLSSFARQALLRQSSPAKKTCASTTEQSYQDLHTTHKKSDIWKPTLPVPERGQRPGPREVLLSLGMAAFREGLGCCFSNPQLLGGNTLSVPTAFLHALARSNLLSSWLHLHRQNRLLFFYSELTCGSRELTVH